MKPLAANVLIVPADTLADQTQNVSFGGVSLGVTAQSREGSAILLPSAAQKGAGKPSEGIVRAIGDDVTLKIVEGDRVLYRSWTGIEVLINGINHQLTPQRDVLAIVDEGERVEIVERPIPQPSMQQPRRAG